MVQYWSKTQFRDDVTHNTSTYAEYYLIHKFKGGRGLKGGNWGLKGGNFFRQLEYSNSKVSRWYLKFWIKLKLSIEFLGDTVHQKWHL